MKPEMLGRQVRRVTPGGFVNPRHLKRAGRGMAADVKEAANRVLEKRGVINQPSAWVCPVFSKRTP